MSSQQLVKMISPWLRVWRAETGIANDDDQLMLMLMPVSYKSLNHDSRSSWLSISQWVLVCSLARLNNYNVVLMRIHILVILCEYRHVILLWWFLVMWFLILVRRVLIDIQHFLYVDAWYCYYTFTTEFHNNWNSLVYHLSHNEWIRLSINLAHADFFGTSGWCFCREQNLLW